MRQINEKSCCFTGHRALSSGEVENIEKELDSSISSLIKKGYFRFLAGGALGFDTLAALMVLKKKKEHPEIKLELILPCFTQAKKWEEKDIKLYEEIKQQADKVIYVSKEYTKGCMFKRNRRLVEESSVCICYLTTNKGGTFYTVSYALKRGIKIVNLSNDISAEKSHTPKVI